MKSIVILNLNYFILKLNYFYFGNELLFVFFFFQEFIAEITFTFNYLILYYRL